MDGVVSLFLKSVRPVTLWPEQYLEAFLKLLPDSTSFIPVLVPLLISAVISGEDFRGQ